MSYSDLLRGTILPSSAINTMQTSVGLPVKPELADKYGYAPLDQWGITNITKSGGFYPPAQAQGGDKWYRDYRKWGRYLGGSAMKALGTAYGGPYDPLAQLQQALSGQIGSPGMASEEDVRSSIGSQVARNQQQLRSYGASMGAPDAMQGMIAAQGRLRQTMANRAVANYMPQAWAQNEAFQNEIGAVLSALAKAEWESEQNLALAGRNV